LFVLVTKFTDCHNSCSLRSRIGDGWAIYNFLPERLPVNEQKAEIFILLLNSVFSAGTTAQKRTKS
jgi:hypothetical protein